MIILDFQQFSIGYGPWVRRLPFWRTGQSTVLFNNARVGLPQLPPSARKVSGSQ